MSETDGLCTPTRDDDGSATKPCEHGHFSKCSDTAEGKSEDGTDEHEDGCADGMRGQSVQCDRYAQDAGPSDEDIDYSCQQLPRVTVSRLPLTKRIRASKQFSADWTKEHSAHVVNGVNFWMIHLEDSDHVIRPGRDDPDDEETDDARDHA